MDRTHIACVIALIIISLPYLSFAMDIPFGGVVTFTEPCDEGLLLTVKEAFGVQNYMWYWGELPYAMHVPPHSGQWLLGMAAPAPGICTIEGEPIGEGFPIIFHGSSN